MGIYTRECERDFIFYSIGNIPTHNTNWKEGEVLIQSQGCSKNFQNSIIPKTQNFT